MKLAVDPEADLDVVLLGADMNVARAFADGLGEDGVDQADHRRLASHALEGGQKDVLFLLLLVLFRLDVDLHRFQHAAQAGLDAVEAADQLRHLPLRANLRLHLAVGQHLDGVEGGDVERIRGADDEQAPLLSQGGDLVLLDEVQRDELGQAGIDGKAVRLVFPDVQLAAEHFDQDLLADQPLAGQKLPQTQAVPALGLFEKRLLELFVRQNAGVDQHLA